jgi:hypothetical protein
MSENEMDNRGSKSTIFLVLVSLLVFVFSLFIFFITSLPVLHFYELLLSNSNILATFPCYSINFSFSALSVNVKNYSTNSSVVPVKIYRNTDLDKLQILKEAKGKSGVYR